MFNEQRPVQILELFGGIGSPRCALRNPSRGIAFPTKNPVKEYTKAQKEFLYDYYMERDCKKEANAIWQEDE